jgi:hypothetical protein
MVARRNAAVKRGKEQKSKGTSEQGSKGAKKQMERKLRQDFSALDIGTRCRSTMGIAGAFN